MALLDYPLWRSVIDFGADPPTELTQNLAALRREIVPEPGGEAHLLTFIGQLADKSGQVPTLSLLEQHYAMLAKQGDPHGFTVQTLLGTVKQANLPFLAPAAYQYAVDEYRDRVLGDGLGTVIQQASSVLSTGYSYNGPTGKAVTLKGPTDAIKFVEAEVQRLLGHFRSASIEGDFLADAASIAARYAHRKANPLAGVRLGYETIDKAHGGLAPGDLALVLGFTGQQKSTFTINVAYNAVVYGKHTVAYVPLESSASALQDAFACIHAQHPKFQPTLTTITYDRVRQGTLSDEEEALFQVVVDDLEHGPYGKLLYKEPDRADMTVGDLFQWAEVKDRTTPLDLLIIDYLALVNPTSGGVAMKESAFANIAVRETKQRAKAFRKGYGLPVLSPWQSNRDGYKEAQKNGGKYDLRALSWAPEAEKSADFVYSVYQDDVMRAGHVLALGNLKARDRRKIDELIELFADPAVRYIADPDMLQPVQNPVPQL